MATTWREQTTGWSITSLPMSAASGNMTLLWDTAEQTVFGSNISVPAFFPLWSSGEMRPVSQEYCLVTGVLLICMTIMASVGNSVVIAVLARQRRGSSPGVTQVFILNLAASHLLLSLLCMPLEVTLYMSGGRWVLGDTLCKVFMYLNAALITSAVTTLTNIAIERFYSVVYPLQRKMTFFKRRMMIVFSWVYAFVFCFPASFALQVFDYRTGKPACQLFSLNPYHKKCIMIVGTTITIFLPLLVTGVAYFWVWRAFRQSQRKVNVATMLKVARVGAIPSSFPISATEKRLLKTLLMMISSFVLLWMPAITARILWITDLPISANFLLTSVWISRAQPMLDPFIYGYVNNQFRRGLRDLLGLEQNTHGAEGGGEGGVFVMHGRQEAVKSPPEVNSPDRCPSRSMFDSGFRQVLAPQGALSTVTGHDGHTHAQAHDEMYLSMEAYIWRSSCQMPRISRMAVRTLPEVSSPPPKAAPPSGSVCRESPATRRKGDRPGQITHVEPVNEDQINSKIGEQHWVETPQRQNGTVYPSVTLNHAHDVLRVEQQSSSVSRTPRLPRRSVVCSNVPASHRDAAPSTVTSRRPLGIHKLPPLPVSPVPQKGSIDATKEANMMGGSTASITERTEFKPRRKRKKILSKRIREKALQSEHK